MPSQIGQRLAFQNAANAVRRAGMNPGGAVLSQSYLRLECAMSTSATQYKFDVLTSENLNGTINTQQKLNLQDAFVVSSLGFFMFTSGSSTAVTAVPSAYPNIGEFGAGTAANFTAAQAKDALAFYNGYLQLTVNQRTLITAWDLMRHLKVPFVQQNALVSPTAASVAPTAPFHPTVDAINGSSDGYYPVEPNIVINGGKKNDLTITLPVAAASIPTSGRLCLIFRGILAQNVTSVN